MKMRGWLAPCKDGPLLHPRCFRQRFFLQTPEIPCHQETKLIAFLIEKQIGRKHACLGTVLVGESVPDAWAPSVFIGCPLVLHIHIHIHKNQIKQEIKGNIQQSSTEQS